MGSHALPTMDERYEAAHYGRGTEFSFDSPTVVGACTTIPRPNGTCDPGRNVAEWTESIEATNRRLRGGSYAALAFGAGVLLAVHRSRRESLSTRGSLDRRDPLESPRDVVDRVVGRAPARGETPARRGGFGSPIPPSILPAGRGDASRPIERVIGRGASASLPPTV